MTDNGHVHEPLPPPSAEATDIHVESVIAALGDTPETVIPVSFLREGACEVLVVGDPGALEGVIIQSFEMPTEPIAFGSSAEAIASLIPHLSGWACLNVPAALADDLIEPVAAAAEAESVRLLDDVYHVLRTPVPIPEAPGVRLLEKTDWALVDAAADLVGGNTERLRVMLRDGHVAGAIRDDRLVAVAHTFALTDHHADIGVVTEEQWRGQGLATAAAALVAGAIQQGGRTPVWSCGSTNLASMRIAARLGFVEVSRRVYLIPEFEDAGGQ